MLKKIVIGMTGIFYLILVATVIVKEFETVTTFCSLSDYTKNCLECFDTNASDFTGYEECPVSFCVL